MAIADFVGLVGVACYLAAYTLLQLGYLRGGSVSYTLMNLTAASCVLISLSSKFNFSSLLIQLFWITISLITLARLWHISKSRGGHDEDRHWAAKLLPSLPIDDGSAFLAAGRRETTRGGIVLLRQGAPVRAMFLLAEGEVEVVVDGVVVRTLGPGEVFGEFGVEHGDPATATVRLVGEGTLYRFDREVLRRRVGADAALATTVQRVIREAARSKLTYFNNPVRTVQPVAA